MQELHDEISPVFQEFGSFDRPEAQARIDGLDLDRKIIDYKILTPIVVHMLTPVHPSVVDNNSSLREEDKGAYRQLWEEAHVAIVNYHAHHEITSNLTK